MKENRKKPKSGSIRNPKNRKTVGKNVKKNDKSIENNKKKKTKEKIKKKNTNPIEFTVIGLVFLSLNLGYLYVIFNNWEDWHKYLLLFFVILFSGYKVIDAIKDSNKENDNSD